MIGAPVFFLVAQTPTAGELLAGGEKALAELEYELAAEELMRAATAPDATPEQRLRAHLLAGTANRIVGHDFDAQLNFRYVLTNAPDTTLPEGTPPKVLTFFEVVRQQVQAEKAAAAPSAPAPSAPTTSSPGEFPLGLVLMGSGAAVGALGAIGLVGAEVYLSDSSANGDTRGGVQVLGVVSAGVIGVGVVAAAVGAAL